MGITTRIIGTLVLDIVALAPNSVLQIRTINTHPLACGIDLLLIDPDVRCASWETSDIPL